MVDDDKKDQKSEGRANSPARAALMYQAAEMYFLDDISRSAIGEVLGISRFRVARLIKEARETGLVKITMMRPDGLDPVRAKELKALWGIDRAIVVPWAPDTELFHLLSEAAASYLMEHVEEHDILGLPSGRTASRVARLIRSLPNCTVVQIAGVAAATTLWESPTETIRQITQLTAGPSYPMFAPIVLSSKLAAETLRQEPGIADAYAHFPRLTKALVGVAPWRAGKSMIHDSVSASDQRLVAAHKPAAEIFANILDTEGREIAQEFSDRALAISISQLRAVPDVIAVGGGDNRRDAILAALRSGFVNTLVTDSMTAQFLIEAGRR